MIKYFKVIGVAFGLLVLSIFIPSSTVLSVFGNVVYYGTPVVLLVLLMRHMPWWVKVVVLAIFFVIPIYVYNNVEFSYHLKYHIYRRTVGFPEDWDPDMQMECCKDFLWSIFWRASFYSMTFLALFKFGRLVYLKWKKGHR